MLRKTLSVMILLVMIGMPAIAMGSNYAPPGQWWNNPEVSKQMDLTEQEITKLDKAYLDNRRNLIDLKSKLERECLELENLLNNEKPNEAEFMRQFGQMENARTQLATERFRFVMEVMKIVGPERYRTLKTMYDKFHKARHRIDRGFKGGHGKGGPDMSGPGINGPRFSKSGVGGPCTAWMGIGNHMAR